MSSYLEELEAWAIGAGSDGCTAVPDFFRVCCLEHDHAYQEGRTMRGVAVTKLQADQRFRDCIQRHSSFRWLSPMSWWRWLAVRKFGRGIWQQASSMHDALYSSPVGFIDAAMARQRILRELFG